MNSGWTINNEDNVILGQNNDVKLHFAEWGDHVKFLRYMRCGSAESYFVGLVISTGNKVRLGPF